MSNNKTMAAMLLLDKFRAESFMTMEKLCQTVEGFDVSKLSLVQLNNLTNAFKGHQTRLKEHQQWVEKMFAEEAGSDCDGKKVTTKK